MLVFEYKALTDAGEKQGGTIEAVSKDLAIENLQRKGLIITSITESSSSSSAQIFAFLNKVPMKEIVFMSRQIATLFEAHVSAYKAFSLVSEQAENPILKQQLHNVTTDLSSGVSITEALARYPGTFSNFYINMVKSGEESGKLSETFTFLAEYMERQYELNRKIRGALIYPIFVIVVFFGVMVLMLRFIVPKLGDMITQSGQPVPVFTKLVLSISNVFVEYGLYMLIVFVVLVIIAVMFLKAEKGKDWLDNAKLKIPAIKTLYNKLYLARIADNLDTMLSSGIPIIRTLEVTSGVVGNRVYARVIKEVSEEVKAGINLSNAFAKHKEIPNMLSQMVRVGEETGMLGQVLKTLGRFYKREVDAAVDNIVSLIEPMMIIVLGAGVGILLVSVLMPIYNVASGF